MQANPILKSVNDTAAAISAGQLVGAPKLLEILFPDSCRPTLRWLRDQQKFRRIPFIKIGHLVFFNPEEVRKALSDRFTVKTVKKG